MKTEFKKSFIKDIHKLKDSKIKDSIAKCIEQVGHANDISEIKNLKKLSGFASYYRIRIGSYRIGIAVEGDTVYFVAIGIRGDFYKSFP